MKSAGSDYWSVCDRLPWATTACRGYNTSEGRWMSPDADGGDVSNPQSLNRYSYALNNPTNLIDPEGLSASAPGWTYASQPGAGGSDPDKCKAPPSPCNTAGNAPDPSVYAAKGQDASTNAIKDFYDLFQFRRVNAGKLTDRAVKRLKGSPSLDHWQKGRERIEAEDLMMFALGVEEDPDPSEEISGKVRIGGKKVNGHGLDRGVVFQDFTQLFPWRTALGNVSFGLEMKGVGKTGQSSVPERAVLRSATGCWS